MKYIIIRSPSKAFYNFIILIIINEICVLDVFGLAGLDTGKEYRTLSYYYFSIVNAPQARPPQH